MTDSDLITKGEAKRALRRWAEANAGGGILAALVLDTEDIIDALPPICCGACGHWSQREEDGYCWAVSDDEVPASGVCEQFERGQG
jgi:hypothetical protein